MDGPTAEDDEDVQQAPSKSRARGIDRAMAVLDYLHERGEPLRISEIAAGIKAPRSSIYEIVDCLIAGRLIETYDGDGRVFLGRRMYFYGMNYAKKFSLIEAGRAALVRLTEQTQETSQLCMLDGGKYTVALMQPGAGMFRISSDPGSSVPIPWTASGRLLVSHLDQEAIEALIPPEDFRLADGEWLDPAEFFVQVKAAKAAGHYISTRQVDAFVSCLAAPVYDPTGQCIATVCFVVPADTAAAKKRDLVKRLELEGRELSSKLGFAP